MKALRPPGGKDNQGRAGEAGGGQPPALLKEAGRNLQQKTGDNLTEAPAPIKGESPTQPAAGEAEGNLRPFRAFTSQAGTVADFKGEKGHDEATQKGGRTGEAGGHPNEGASVPLALPEEGGVGGHVGPAPFSEACVTMSSVPSSSFAGPPPHVHQERVHAWPGLLCIVFGRCLARTNQHNSRGTSPARGATEKRAIAG